MRWIFALGFAFVIWFGFVKSTFALVTFGSGPDTTSAPNCTLYQIQGTFTASSSGYNLSGTCEGDAGPIRWAARGGYTGGATSNNTMERIDLLGSPVDNKSLGTIQSVMLCDADPWLVNLPCRKDTIKVSASGTVSQPQWQAYLQELIQIRWGRPATAALPLDRDALNAKRRADLDAAQRLAQLAKQKLTSGAQELGAQRLFFPSFLSPTARQTFYAQTPVPIKLAPPSGWNVTSYLVSIQRRDANGNWIVQTNIPVSAAEAQSAQGYVGFGAGGNGPTKSPAFITAPGTWGARAQIASPRQSGWSDIVPFIVTAPKFTAPASAAHRIVK